MIAGTVLSAVVFGLVFAIGMLVAGYPIWLGLVVYSGGGLVCALLITLWRLARSNSADGTWSRRDWQHLSDSQTQSIHIQ